MEDLTQNHVFGKVIGHSHPIKVQKRGLPRAHILLIFSPLKTSQGVLTAMTTLYQPISPTLKTTQLRKTLFKEHDPLALWDS